jgi:hypothetical protein
VLRLPGASVLDLALQALLAVVVGRVTLFVVGCWKREPMSLKEEVFSHSHHSVTGAF